MAEDSTKAPGAAAPPAARLLDQGKRQFIIAPRRGSQAVGTGLRPMPAAAMRALVGQLPGLEIVRVLRPRRGVSGLSVIPDEATEVYVARIDPDRAELIRQMMPPQLVIEEDALLEYADAHRPRASRPGAARLLELRGRRRDPPDPVPGDRRGRQAAGQCRGEPHRRGIPPGGANGQEGRGHHAPPRLAGQARPLPLRQLAEQLLGSLSHRAGAPGRRGERRPAPPHRRDDRGIPGALPVWLGPAPDGAGPCARDARWQGREGRDRGLRCRHDSPAAPPHPSRSRSHEPGRCARLDAGHHRARLARCRHHRRPRRVGENAQRLRAGRRDPRPQGVPGRPDQQLARGARLLPRARDRHRQLEPRHAAAVAGDRAEARGSCVPRHRVHRGRGELRRTGAVSGLVALHAWRSGRSGGSTSIRTRRGMPPRCCPT